MAQDNRLKIFLSYARQNRLIAQTIQDAIADAGFHVWLDTEIQVGMNWESTILAELDESDVLILLLSNDALTSEWVRQEYIRFLELQKPILPVIVRQVDYSLIPPELSTIQYVDAADGLHSDQINRILEALYYYAEEQGKLPNRPSTVKKKMADGAPFVQFANNYQQSQNMIPPQQPVVSPPSKKRREVSEPVKDDTTLRIVHDDQGLSALSDSPIEDPKQDLLGFRDYASAIAEFIMHEKTDKPLAISINAEWGGGKSSLMYMIQHELRPDLPKVWFNAWKYDGQEALWAALALTVFQQTTKDKPFAQRLRLQRKLMKFNSRKFATDFARGLLNIVIFLIIGLAIILVVNQLQDVPFDETFNQIMPALILGGSGITLYQVGKKFIGDVQNTLNLNINDYFQEQPDYAARLGFLQEFQDNFKEVVKLITDDYKNPLVIFIDDLDRCSVPRVAELIEAMNIFLSSEGCVFVVGMDMKAVAASIEIRYGNLRTYLAGEAEQNDPALGRFFLEKIVQISFPIPRVDHEKMMRFVRANMGHIADDPEKPDNSRAETLHSELREDLKPIYSSKEIYDFIYEKVTNEIKAEEDWEDPVEKDEIEIAIAYQEELDRITALSQQVFAAEILDRFNEIEEVMAVIEAMLPYLDYNPRRVKRFINIFRLQAFIAIKRGSLVDSLQLNALGTWLEIALRWPDFAIEMIADPNLDDELYFVSATRAQLGNDIEKVKDQQGFQKRIEDMEALEKKPPIAKHKEDQALLSLLTQTTAFNDDDAVDILQLAVQIASSARLKQIAARAKMWQ